MSDPKPAALDFSTVATPKIKPKPDAATQNRALVDSHEAGFHGRAETIKIDRRTTRPRQSIAKVQINVKVNPETRSRFVAAAQKAGNKDAAVLNLGGFFEKVWAFYETHAADHKDGS